MCFGADPSYDKQNYGVTLTLTPCLENNWYRETKMKMFKVLYIQFCNLFLDVSLIANQLTEKAENKIYR